MANDVTISSPEQFQATLNTLTTLRGQLDSALKASDAVTEAAEAAAKPGTGASDEIAPALEPFTSSLHTDITKVNELVNAGGGSIGSVTSDLAALLRGITGTDTTAAETARAV
ncbi:MULTISPECIES: hypothetical protein [Mycobacteriaceae]|uniref:PE domain-containing protein n=3 Tax=Mycobacteriaceae TaxID=1762 RepID=A0A1Q9WG26_9MYCO|nr:MULTISPECIES: hypothetical protein [Mycobacteriaceae]MBP2451830.1 hypothetical protein [Mycolicibacterium lutetiense]OHT92453.1 hypothetical protein BKG61_24180 [Mycobacterium syngnathidarum]OLT97724.1 hypothetical protein BKG60_04990 [Mycobacterium syngnathidarum]